jgi:chaperonin GroEL (HSP60 family)
VIFALLKNLGKLSNDKTKSNLLYFSGTIEDTELVDGLILDQKTIGFGAPTRIEKAKIGLIQYCISPPKTDV